MADAGIPLPNNWHRISYFHCSLFGYFLGLLTATISSEVCHQISLTSTLDFMLRRDFIHNRLDIICWYIYKYNRYMDMWGGIVWKHAVELINCLNFLQIFKAAQPALLYLVPFTLAPLFAMAYVKGDLRTMWHEPFAKVPPPKYQEIWRVLNQFSNLCEQTTNEMSSKSSV